MIKYLTCLFSPLLLCAQAPDIAWQKRIGSTNYDLPYSMCPTSDGGYFLGDYSGSNAYYEKSENCRGGSDYWVVKVDQAGNVEWDKTIGGAQSNGKFSNENDHLYSVKQTSDNGYVLCGYSNSPISAEKTESCRGYNDFWIIKLDSAGDIVWQRTIGGSLDDKAYSVITTIDNGLLISGNSRSDISDEKSENSRGEVDVWLVKLNSEGVIEWQRTIGGSGVESASRNSIFQTNDGNFILASTSNSGISGEKTENCRGGVDVWVLLLDDTGNILLQKTIGGSADDAAAGVIGTADGGYLISSSSNSPISGEKTDFCRGEHDRWILKLDNSLSIIWQKTYGGDNDDGANVALECNDGGFLISGSSRSGISGEKLTPVSGYTDAWILKLNNMGEITWQKTIGGTAPGIYDGQDSLSDPVQLIDNSFVLGGGTSSEISGDIVDFPRGSTDYWLVKLEAENLSIYDEVTEAFVVYPNPVESEIKIKFQSVEPSVEIMLYNSLSQLIIDKQYASTDSINLHFDYPSGIYFLKIKSGESFKTVKVLKK